MLDIAVKFLLIALLAQSAFEHIKKKRAKARAQTKALKAR